MMHMYFKYLIIGKIVNTQGIKGEVRVVPTTDSVDRFDDLHFVYIDDQKLIRADVEHVRHYKGLVIIKFKGIDSIDDAEKYRNTYILVDRENAVKLPEGSYFICDMIGLDVFDIGGALIGRIDDVLTTGSNDVYVVRGDDGETLVPALKSVVKSIDLERNRITIEMPEEL